jgi:uncharacterized protein (TIGR03084 family)
VVLHLAQTDEMAVASLEGRMAGYLAERTAGRPAATVDEGADLMVQRERGMDAGALIRRWRSGAAELVSALRSADSHRRVVWVAGELSVRTLTTTRLAEAWIHTGDVAEALGTKVKEDDRLFHIARLAWRTLPYAFERAGMRLAGPVAFELSGPAGEEWRFFPDEPPATVVRGPGSQLCLVAARRLDPDHTRLEADGPDAAAVLSLVRTYA